MPSILFALSDCRPACKKCELKVMPERQCCGLTGTKPVTSVIGAEKAPMMFGQNHTSGHKTGPFRLLRVGSNQITRNEEFCR